MAVRPCKYVVAFNPNLSIALYHDDYLANKASSGDKDRPGNLLLTVLESVLRRARSILALDFGP